MKLSAVYLFYISMSYEAYCEAVMIQNDIRIKKVQSPKKLFCKLENLDCRHQCANKNNNGTELMYSSKLVLKVNRTIKNVIARIVYSFNLSTVFKKQ
jgi:hypothetical protein